MKLANRETQFELPADLHDKLMQFRQRVWFVKTAEVSLQVFSLAAACYLAVFALDRLGEAPAWARLSLLGLSLIGLLCGIPWKLYRWVWRRRRFDQLARLLAWSRPNVGDRLLGVVNLVENQHRQLASPTLCRAAIKQVADETRAIDFRNAVPSPSHRMWARVAGFIGSVAVVALLVPGAGANAFHRWLMPLADIQRYTFTQLVGLPMDQVVAIGEPFQLAVDLAENTVWRPRYASARYGNQQAIRGELVEGGYVFELPAQTKPAQLHLAVGDARHRIPVRPLPRPELKSLIADIQLPSYLGHEDQVRDVRSGAVSVVKGSQTQFKATASRPLSRATVNGDQRRVVLDGATLRTSSVAVEAGQEQEFRWTDIDGLSSKSPFKLRIRAVDDRAPTIQCRNLPNDRVILAEETSGVRCRCDRRLRRQNHWR